MSNFKARFDERFADARRAFGDNSPAVREKIAGFFTVDFERLLKSISSLLEKVDKGQVDHPEYLVSTTGNVAEQAVSLITSVPDSFSNGVDYFLQSVLTGLVGTEERLVKAVGSYYYKVKEVKDQYVKQLQKLNEEALSYYEDTVSYKEDIGKIRDEYETARQSIVASSASADAAIHEIAAVRQKVESLASGDGRGRSLEALKRRAEAKLAVIEDTLVKGATSAKAAESALSRLSETENKINDAVSNLKNVEQKASEILALSNQAGLASSYLTESRKLAQKSFAYTIILYVASISTLALAAFYVIPSIQPTVEGAQAALSEGVLLATLLRASILAPLVFVIYFTTKQISGLETLRMDYAEKAAASLAYSGYKDEMSVDTDLLEQLRGSLLLRFAEHPERLLRKRPASESIQIRLPGFSATSNSDDRRRSVPAEPNVPTEEE